MSKKTINPLDSINDMIELGKKQGVIHLMTEDESYDGRVITVNGRKLINFGSCSYLGLELDERVKNGAIDAIQRYGIQFSSSRSYAVCALYDEWEDLLRQMFGAEVALFTSLSLGHHSVIPVVVEPGDAIILDQNVHASVQDAARKAQLNGVLVTKVRHNRLDLLEAEIQKLSRKYKKIWYMVDGIYSMYGDMAPMPAIYELMNKYDQLHVYADDAHGMSIAGKNGTGTVLEQTPHHEKLILAVSLCKAYGCGGGAFVFKDPMLCNRVKNCGGSYIFSGGHQIPVIGAGIESAKIHLSPEIYQLQTTLYRKISYCYRELIAKNLPVVSLPHSPIFYIGLGMIKVGYNLVNKLIKNGCFVNLGMFPAVSERRTGVRFTITNHHTKEDIDQLVELLAHYLPISFEEEKRTMDDITRGFKNVSVDSLEKLNIPKEKKEKKYTIQHEKSIQNIPADIWNSLLGSKGANDWNQMQFFENAFSGNDLPEHNWEFDYYLIRDEIGEPVLATYFTTTISKDDMFAPSDVSKQIAFKRFYEPYYLCSKTMMMGCLLSVGQHIYIDRLRSDWKKIVGQLLDEVWKQQQRNDAEILTLRDFRMDDLEMKYLLLEQGFIQMEIPSDHKVLVSEKSVEEYATNLSSEQRRYIKRRAIEKESLYEIRLLGKEDKYLSPRIHELYSNVSKKSFEIVGFELTRSFFDKALENDQWEIIALFDRNSQQNSLVGMTLSYRTETRYTFLVTGMDYSLNKKFDLYSQLLWQVIKRGVQLEKEEIILGLTASQNKRKFGANSIRTNAYFQLKDSLNASIIQLMVNKKS